MSEQEAQPHFLQNLRNLPGSTVPCFSNAIQGLGARNLFKKLAEVIRSSKFLIHASTETFRDFCNGKGINFPRLLPMNGRLSME